MVSHPMPLHAFALGFVTYALRFGDKPQDPVAAIEYLSMKLGLVMLVLGCIHLINIKVFNTMRTRALQELKATGPKTAQPSSAMSDLVAQGRSMGNTPA
jgi:hypothetical protein